MSLPVGQQARRTDLIAVIVRCGKQRRAARAIAVMDGGRDAGLSRGPRAGQCGNAGVLAEQAGDRAIGCGKDNVLGCSMFSKRWCQVSPFSAADDWIFASPLKIGKLPYSYTGFWRELKRAAAVAKIGDLATHAFRHTYRTWLDSIGTPVGVQQRLMRHADIRTTMNQYGSALSADMQQAQGKVIQLV